MICIGEDRASTLARFTADNYPRYKLGEEFRQEVVRSIAGIPVSEQNKSVRIVEQLIDKYRKDVLVMPWGKRIVV